MKNKKDIVVLNYDLGNACNLRCKFCYNDTRRNEKQFYREYKLVVLDLILLSKKTNKIFFIGGEPLFHPKILDILNITKRIGFKEISIVTNGVRLSDDDFAKKLLGQNINNLIFSIHAHNKELDEKISSRKNIFEKRLKGLENFKKYNNNTRIALNLVLNNINIFYIDEIVEFYYKKGFKVINLYGMLQGLSFSKTNIDMIPIYKDVIFYVNKIRKYKDLTIGVHWIPLCISSQLNNTSFIREIKKNYIYNIRNNGTKLFDNQISHKMKLKECNNCYAYGKFCFGLYKQYYKKYGGEEFKSINKKELYEIIKKYNR